MNARRKKRNSDLSYGQLEARQLLAVDVGIDIVGTTGNSNSVEISGEVGESYVVQIANNRFSVFDKSDGSLVRASNTKDFWSNAGITLSSAPVESTIVMISDFNKWAVSAIDSDNPNRVLLAVSKTSNPTGQWDSFEFLADPSNATSVVELDLEIAARSLILKTINDGTSQFNQSLFSVPTSDLRGDTPTIENLTQFTGLDADNVGSSFEVVADKHAFAFDGLLVGTTDQGDELVLTNVEDNYSDSAMLSDSVSISVPMYEQAPEAEQAGGILIDSPTPSESLSAVRTMEYITSSETNFTTFAAHNVKGSFDNVAIRWYFIDETTSAILDTGLLEDPNMDYLNPSVSSSGNFLSDRPNDGVFTIGFTATGPDAFPSSAVALGYSEESDTGNEVFFHAENVQIVREGTSAYDNPDENGLNRLSESGATRVFNTRYSNSYSFWNFHAFSTGTQNWATNISQQRLVGLDFVFQGDDSDNRFEFWADKFGPGAFDTIMIDGGGGNDELFVYNAGVVASVVDSIVINGGDGDDTIRVTTSDLSTPIAIDGGEGVDNFSVQDFTYQAEFSHVIDAMNSFTEEFGSDERITYESIEDYRFIGNDVDVYTPKPGTRIDVVAGDIRIWDPSAFVVISGGTMYSTFTMNLSQSTNVMFENSRASLVLIGTEESDSIVFEDQQILVENGNAFQVSELSVTFLGQAGDDTVVVKSNESPDTITGIIVIAGNEGNDRVSVIGNDEANKISIGNATRGITLGTGLSFLDVVETVSLNLGLGNDDYSIFRFSNAIPQPIGIFDTEGDDTFQIGDDFDVDVRVDLGPGSDSYLIYAEHVNNSKVAISDSSGNDSLEIDYDYWQESVFIAQNGNSLVFDDDVVEFEQIEDLIIRTGFADDQFYFNELAHQVTVYAGWGDDSIYANSASDLQDSLTVYGHNGNDTLEVSGGFNAQLDFSGGEGEDSTTVKLSRDQAGLIRLLDSHQDQLTILGHGGRDYVAIRDNNVISRGLNNELLQTIEYRADNESYLTRLDFDLKGGDDITSLYGSASYYLTVNGRAGRDYFVVNGTHRGQYELNGGSGLDTFHVAETSADTVTKLIGHTQNDFFYLGSNQVRDSGDLGLLSGRILISGGQQDDWVYLNDNQADGNFGYYVGNGYIGNQVTNVSPERPGFRGVYFSDDPERLRLDGTEGQNFFTVVPNSNTGIVVDGRSPTTTEGGDALYIPGENDGRSLVEFGLNNGIWSFENGSRKIRYYSIEAVDRPGEETAARRAFVPAADSNDEGVFNRNLVNQLEGHEHKQLSLSGSQSVDQVASDTNDDELSFLLSEVGTELEGVLSLEADELATLG